VTDPKITVTCPGTTLAVGAHMICTGTYALTQADISAGETINHATTTGTGPDGTDVSDDDTATVPLVESPAITLVKTGALAATAHTPVRAGDTVAYTFTVTNEGNVPLDNIHVTDPKVGTVTCVDTRILVGASTQCTGTYTLLQTDIDAGKVDNHATADGTGPDGTTVHDDDTATVDLPPSPGISIDKAGVLATTVHDPVQPGDLVDYTLTVTNTGNVSLHAITVSDPLVGPVTCPQTTLAVGAHMVCTAHYALRQTNIDAGVVLNTASVDGQAPDGTPVDDTGDATVDVPQVATITLDKQGTLDLSAHSPVRAGDQVNYTFLVTNTGNVTINSIKVTDPLLGSPTAVTCESTTLDPGAATECAATYLIKLADVDAGHVMNTATATGKDPGGDDVPPALDSFTVPLGVDPSLDLNKVANRSTLVVGDKVTYQFTITNSGNTTVTGVNLDEVAFTGTPTLTIASCTGPSGTTATLGGITLKPGEIAICTSAPYTVRQADMDSGLLENTATATGKDSGGGDVVSPPSDVTIDAVQNPGIWVKKTVNSTTLTAGQTLTYSYLVRNTGNVTLNNVTVTEARADFTGTGALPVPHCPRTTLAPLTEMICTATYVVTQQDVDNGRLANLATASGLDPKGTMWDDTSSTTIPQEPLPELVLVKSAVPATIAAVGDTVTYSFKVTNTGNVTINHLSIADTFSGDQPLGTITCPVTTLAPLASTTCTATYHVTQADLDAGKLTNTAKAGGDAPGGGGVESPPSTWVIPVELGPALDLQKSSDVSTVERAGDIVRYTFTVKNTGNLTITGINIVDPLVGTITCPATTLRPTLSTVCTGSYTVTQADIDSGAIVNTAIARGKDPGGSEVVSPPSTRTVTADPVVELTLGKGAIGQVNQGQVIDYSFTIINTGTVTMTGVSIAEVTFTGHGQLPSLSGLTCTTATAPKLPVTLTTVHLAPGASVVCLLPGYVATAADAAAGQVDNTAVVKGTAVTPQRGGTTPVPITSDPSKAHTVVVAIKAPTGGTVIPR